MYMYYDVFIIININNLHTLLFKIRHMKCIGCMLCSIDFTFTVYIYHRLFHMLCFVWRDFSFACSSNSFEKFSFILSLKVK